MPLYTPNGTSDHDALINVSADDHHAQVHTVDGGDHTGTLAIGQIPTGTSGTTVALGDAAAGLVTTHEAAGDPHPIYATEAEASAQVATHAGLADPHTGYRLESADHTHASTGLQAGQVAHSALTTVTATDHHAAPVAGPDANIVVDAAGAAGTASTFARSAHGHRVDTDAGVASTQAFGDAAITGTSGTIQRQGHKHAMPANPVTAHEAAGDPHTGYLLESLADVAGDLLVASAADAWARLARGTDGQVLKMSGTTVGWGADLTGAGSDPVQGSYTPGSFTVPTGFYAQMVKRLQLTSSQRLTAAGTGRLSLTN